MISMPRSWRLRLVRPGGRMRLPDADRPDRESAAFGRSAALSRLDPGLRRSPAVPLSPAHSSKEQSNQATQCAFRIGTPPAIAANSTSRRRATVTLRATLTWDGPSRGVYDPELFLVAPDGGWVYPRMPGPNGTSFSGSSGLTYRIVVMAISLRRRSICSSRCSDENRRLRCASLFRDSGRRSVQRRQCRRHRHRPSGARLSTRRSRSHTC